MVPALVHGEPPNARRPRANPTITPTGHSRANRKPQRIWRWQSREPPGHVLARAATHDVDFACWRAFGRAATLLGGCLSELRESRLVGFQRGGVKKCENDCLNGACLMLQKTSNSAQRERCRLGHRIAVDASAY